MRANRAEISPDPSHFSQPPGENRCQVSAFNSQAGVSYALDGYNQISVRLNITARRMPERHRLLVPDFLEP